MSAPAAGAWAAPRAQSALRAPESSVVRRLDGLDGRPAASTRLIRHFAMRCADLP
jgi:hypothetical protein